MADFLLINDPSGSLNGKLDVHVMSGSAGANGRDVHRSPSAICGNSLNVPSPVTLIPVRGADSQPNEGHPLDTFLRTSPAAAGAAGNPGLCSETLTPWRVLVGAFSNAQGANNGTLQATTPGQCLVPVLRGRWGGRSRLIEADFVDSSYASQSGLWVHRATSAGGGVIKVYFTSNVVQLSVNGTVITNAQLNGSNYTVTNGTAYTLSVAVTVSPSGALTRIRVYVNGTKINDYFTTTAQQTTLAVPANSVYPFLEDGINLAATTTQVNGFRVREFTTEEPYQRSGTTTLVAGTVTIADAHITANSIIRLNRQAAGGTLGELSVALTAGTSFTINSNNAADTSTIYYEIVSY